MGGINPGSSFLVGRGGGRELVRGNCPGSKSPRVIVLGDFMGDNCPGGSRPWGNIVIPLKHKK